MQVNTFSITPSTWRYNPSKTSHTGAILSNRVSRTATHPQSPRPFGHHLSANRLLGCWVKDEVNPRLTAWCMSPKHTQQFAEVIVGPAHTYQTRRSVHAGCAALAVGLHTVECQLSHRLHRLYKAFLEQFTLQCLLCGRLALLRTTLHTDTSMQSVSA